MHILINECKSTYTWGLNKNHVTKCVWSNYNIDNGDDLSDINNVRVPKQTNITSSFISLADDEHTLNGLLS